MTENMIAGFLLIVILLAIYYSSIQKKLKEMSDEIESLKEQLRKSDHSLSVSEAEKTIPTETPTAETPNKKTPILTTIKIEDAAINIPRKQSVSSSKPSFLDLGIEFLKQNFLSVLGITTLVIGIGYFVKYAIDKNWINENLRVLMGIAAGFGITGIGYYLKRNYRVFSSILIGGGIAVLYFTVTIAFREYQLFSQNAAFILVSAITLFAIALSYFLKNEVLLVLAFAGGFGAPLMVSTGNADFDFLFVYLLILNLGMLLIYRLRQYRSLVLLTFVLTGIYLIFRFFEPLDIHFVYFMYAFAGIYILAALIKWFRNGELPIADQVLLVAAHLLYVGLLLFAFENLKIETNFLAPLSFALLNTSLALSAYKMKKWTPAFSVFLVLAMAMLTLAFAVAFDADSLVVLFGVESILLLYIWLKQKQRLFLYSFIVSFMLSFFTLLLYWSELNWKQQIPPFFNTEFFTGFFFVILSSVGFYLAFLSHLKNRNSDFIGKVLFGVAAGVLYIILFAEFSRMMQKSPSEIENITLFLYTLYFLFALFYLTQKLFGNEILKTLFYFVFLALFIAIPTYTSSYIEFSTDVFRRSLWFLIPFVVIIYSIYKDLSAGKLPEILFWLGAFTFAFVISTEIQHLYQIITAQENSYLYSVLYLPVIWTLIAILFIFLGIRKNIPELNRAGFILIGIMVLKLYLFDVWKMDQVSRITAFILLGILLLVSSFMFQKLKRMISRIMDSKTENES